MAKLKVSIAGELASDGSRPPQPLQYKSVSPNPPPLKSWCGYFRLSFNTSKALAARLGSLTLVNLASLSATMQSWIVDLPLDRAERHLKALGYFKTVKITAAPGSSPDRVVVDAAGA
jgi:hypothetical protein